MLGLFKKRPKRIEIQGDSIFINNDSENMGRAFEIDAIFNFSNSIPELKVYENRQLVRLFKIETLQSNADLSGQFLHSNIRILPNSGVMIDGIISKSNLEFRNWTDENYEAIRFQPFYLSNANDNNFHLKGKGLFERGLHYSGTITPTGVRNICVCDDCKKSFTIQHFHAGFSEVQYFYSSDSSETLTVSYGEIENLPVQLQENIDLIQLKIVERELSEMSNTEQPFRYYNSFMCPHCLAPFIDFENNKAIRPKEYYGNTYINKLPVNWTKKKNGT